MLAVLFPEMVSGFGDADWLRAGKLEFGTRRTGRGEGGTESQVLNRTSLVV